MKKIPVLYRILFIILIIGVYLIYNAYPCIMLSIKGVPVVIKENLSPGIDKIVLLYGGGVCGPCPQGKFVYSLKDRNAVLFVVPEEFTDNEKDNMIRAFALKGKMINGNPDVTLFLERLVKCSREGDWKKNFYAELGKKNELKKVKPF